MVIVSRSNEFFIGSGTPKPMEMDSFNEYFKAEGEKKLRKEPVNYQALMEHPGVKLIGERVAESADRARKLGLEEKAFDFYPNELRKMKDIGQRFNSARQEKGLKTYFPHTPEVAGALLLGGYSQRNAEHIRKLMVEKSASTGILVPHINTERMNNMIENDIHPLKEWSLKLRDFIGSSINPNTWHGEHDGEHLGLGYTIDRHQHDIAMHRKFGESNRGISSGDSGARRYRVMQAGHEVGHNLYDPNRNLSIPQFQSLSWGGIRGSYN